MYNGCNYIHKVLAMVWCIRCSTGVNCCCDHLANFTIIKDMAPCTSNLIWLAKTWHHFIAAWLCPQKTKNNVTFAFPHCMHDCPHVVYEWRWLFIAVYLILRRSIVLSFPASTSMLLLTCLAPLIRSVFVPRSTLDDCFCCKRGWWCSRRVLHSRYCWSFLECLTHFDHQYCSCSPSFHVFYLSC